MRQKAAWKRVTTACMPTTPFHQLQMQDPCAGADTIACPRCRAQAAAERELRAKEKAAARRKAAILKDLNEARAMQAADKAAAAAAAAEAALADAAALSAAAQQAAAEQERRVCHWMRPQSLYRPIAVFLNVAEGRYLQRVQLHSIAQLDP